MTVDEIFAKLKAHFIEGLMFHNQQMEYYDFLNLKGLKTLSEYRYFEESKGYVDLCKFYMKNYGKLILEADVDSSSIIPKSWYNHEKVEVDINTKRNAIKDALAEWISWEKETKKLLEDMYKELINLGEINSAVFIEGHIADVVKEIGCANDLQLEFASFGYDLVPIIEVQNYLDKKYKEKLRVLFD